MNVLFVYDLPGAVGGSERSLHLAARSLGDSGHRVHLLHGDAQFDASRAPYVSALALPTIFTRRKLIRPNSLPQLEAQVERYISDKSIDVIHAHSWPRESVLKRWAARHPVVATVHIALCPDNTRYLPRRQMPCDRQVGIGCFTAGFCRLGCGNTSKGVARGTAAFFRDMYKDHRLRQAIALCARVITPSEFLRQRFIRDGIPEAILRVVHPPIENVSVGAAGALPGGLARPDPPVILFVGRLVEFKGAHHVLKASALIERPHQVWFVGSGPERSPLEKLAVELGIQSRVTHFGTLGPESIHQLRLRSAVQVVPSLWAEVFGMVGPEAFLAGCPVVAYSSGGIPEWAIECRTARVVPTGDVGALARRIEEVLSQPAEARKLAENGRAMAQQWSVDRHAAALAAIYEEIAPQPASSRLTNSSPARSTDRQDH